MMTLGNISDIKTVSGFKENTFINDWNDEKKNQLGFFIPELIKLICEK